MQEKRQVFKLGIEVCAEVPLVVRMPLQTRAHLELFPSYLLKSCDLIKISVALSQPILEQLLLPPLSYGQEQAYGDAKQRKSNTTDNSLKVIKHK